MSNHAPLPLARSILFADHIITEDETHKKSLIGVFSSLVSFRMPVRKNLSVYVQLSDAHGEYMVTLELVMLKTGAIVHRGDIGPIIARDPLLPVELVLKLPCKFEDYGDYEFRLLHEGRVFASQILSLRPAPFAPSPQNRPAGGDAGGE
jgi:hypothetical protein